MNPRVQAICQNVCACPVSQVIADQINKLRITIQRRLNRSARYPPMGLSRAYTHMNNAMRKPKSASLAMVGRSARMDVRMVASNIRSR